MTLDDLAKDIANTVKESVQEAVKSLSEKYESRIAELEEQIKSIPVPLKGDKGDSITVDDVRPMLEEMVKAIEVPKGEDGESVTLDDIAPLVKEAVEGIQIPVPDISHLEKRINDVIASIPNPEKGDDGISPSPDEVAKSMEHIFAKWALDFERKADHVLEKAIDRMPKAKDGRDALDIDDFELSLGEDGRTITASLKRGETVIEKSVKIPAILDRGVYSEDDKYEKGDGVTYAGSYWIVQKDSPEGRPSSSADFRLAVKRGRDGKEVVKLEKPQTVKVAV